MNDTSSTRCKHGQDEATCVHCPANLGPNNGARPVMLCGHVANARQGFRVVCRECFASDDTEVRFQSVQVDTAKAELDGRRATCAQCGASEPSSLSLPNFQFEPDMTIDSFYDGCKGWD